MNWRSRIVGLTEEPPDQLLANPMNPRRHPGRQRDVMRAVLDDLGFVAPVIVNDTTGRLVDGHLRVEEALSAGTAVIPVVHVELSEAEEMEAIATLDPVSALARYDAARLVELLAEVRTESSAIIAMLADVSKRAVVIDEAPLPEHRTELPEVRTLVLVYSESEWHELLGLLRRVPGETSAAKVLTLARHAVV